MSGRRNVVIALSVLVSLIGFTPTALAAHTVDWQGITWGHSYGDIALSTAGNLEVISSTCVESKCWGAAHYNTPSSLRSAPDHSVTFSFEDPGPGMHGGQIWIEKEGSPNAAWTQFGAWDGDTTYGVYWWNVDTGQAGFLDTGIARTAGIHTLTVGKRADGTVDYYIDGNLVYTNPMLNMGYIGDVYLTAQSTAPNPETIVFTAYSSSESYVVAAPNIIETLCVASATGTTTANNNGSCGRLARVIYVDDDPTFCINRVNGEIRVAIGKCSKYEISHILTQDGDLMACRSLQTNRLRAVTNFGYCSRYERPAYILAPSV